MNAGPRVALLAVTVLLAPAKAPAAVYHLKETLAELPTTAMVSGDGKAETATGRRKGEKALRLEHKSLTWRLDRASAPVFAEFWLRADGWDARSRRAVELAQFAVGSEVLTLGKPAGAAVLELSVGEQGLASWPIYNWTEQEWMAKHPDGRWHYVLIGLTEEGRPRLTVDGFAARELHAASLRGALREIRLNGGPGTQFSWLHVVGAPVPEGEALRTRFRSLYRGLPDLHKNTFTVPRLRQAPTIDGKLDAEEWSRAARVTGFSSLKKRTLRQEDVYAYAGYDDRHLYLALHTPYAGELRAKHHRRHDMPLWGEESYEIFLHPPYTGTPDFCQLIGNPYGDQADLKMLNLAWDGKWAWKTTVTESEWVAECCVDFEGVDAPRPGDFAVWTMNMISSYADAAWCWTQRYNDSASFGVMRFDASAPVLRPGAIAVASDTVRVPLEVRGGEAAQQLTASLQLYGEADVLPVAETVRKVALRPGQVQTFELTLELGTLTAGKLALAVRDGETEYLFQSVAFPTAAMVTRTGYPSTKLEATTPAKPAAVKKPTALTDAEKACQRRWSAEELGQVLLDSAEWLDGSLGLADDVPKPWTPMQVEGQVISCWNREVVYGDSLLPIRIRSGAGELLAAPARFELRCGGKRHTFEQADVTVEKQSDGLVAVHAQSRSGPFLLETNAQWEFDGMGRIELALSCPGEVATVERFAIELPIAEARAKLFHLTSSRSGHSPNSTSDAVPTERMALDAFREVVWIGDHDRGLCWFAESLDNWQIADETAIQVLEPRTRGARVLSVKLADQPFAVERPWRVVFGLQAAPTRPRRPDFRTFADRRSFAWCWFWRDGSYYPWQSTHVDKARAQIATARAAGREVMPCSSLRFYGRARHHRGYFGEISNPGMIVPEHLIWGPLWQVKTTPIEMPRMPEKHTAPGRWYGQKYKPGSLVSYCASSPFQDLYIWKLARLIQDTGLGDIYLDQPITGCSNAHHGCGYINYRGEWTPTLPLSRRAPSGRVEPRPPPARLAS